MTEQIPTPTISEILQQDFMAPADLSAYRLAKELHVPVSRIQDLLHDRRQVTVDTSVRLGRFFGVSDDYFLRLQNDIDLRNAEQNHGQEYAQIRCWQE
ncbi:HigA family addiction module antidote protein [Limosilactobacillus fermentum]